MKTHLPLWFWLLPKDWREFLIFAKYDSPSAFPSSSSSSLGPPSGISCFDGARFRRCPVGSLVGGPYSVLISKSPYIRFIRALFSSINRSIRSLKRVVFLKFNSTFFVTQLRYRFNKKKKKWETGFYSLEPLARLNIFSFYSDRYKAIKEILNCSLWGSSWLRWEVCEWKKTSFLPNYEGICH